MQTDLTIPLELKTLKTRQIEGHGSIFGNVDLGGDVVARGAFRDTLAEHEAAGTMPQMFFMHDWSKVPGRWDDMAEDELGLAVKGTLAKTDLGNEMRELLQMKAVRGLSIGFFINDAEYKDDGVRVIKSVDLIETSIVSLAMNPLAQITAAKSRLSAAGEYVPTPREFERRLRDVGLSQRIAKRLVATMRDETSYRDDSELENAGIAELLDALDRDTSQAHVDTIRAITRT